MQETRVWTPAQCHSEDILFTCNDTSGQNRGQGNLPISVLYPHYCGRIAWASLGIRLFRNSTAIVMFSYASPRSVVSTPSPVQYSNSKHMGDRGFCHCYVMVV